MVPDWLQLGLLLAVSFVVGAARLPGVPPLVGRTAAIVRGVLGMWIVRVVLINSFAISPLAELTIPESIKVFGAAAALLAGTLLPLTGGIAAQRRHELSGILVGTVLGLVTLFAGPTSLVISAALIITVVLAGSAKTHSGLLIPLLAGVPVLIYATGNRSIALVTALSVMGAAMVFEVARLLWPTWNRQLMQQIGRFVSTHAITGEPGAGHVSHRPLGFSSATVGVALLVALLDSHAALVATSIGLLLPTLTGVILAELRQSAEPRASTNVRAAALVLAAVLLLLLLLPGSAGERWNIGAAIVFTSALSGILGPAVPVDAYLLALVAAGATFVVL